MFLNFPEVFRKCSEIFQKQGQLCLLPHYSLKMFKVVPKSVPNFFINYTNFFIYCRRKLKCSNLFKKYPNQS